MFLTFLVAGASAICCEDDEMECPGEMYPDGKMSTNFKGTSKLCVLKSLINPNVFKTVVYHTTFKHYIYTLIQEPRLRVLVCPWPWENSASTIARSIAQWTRCGVLVAWIGMVMTKFIKC